MGRINEEEISGASDSAAHAPLITETRKSGRVVRPTAKARKIEVLPSGTRQPTIRRTKRKRSEPTLPTSQPQLSTPPLTQLEAEEPTQEKYKNAKPTVPQ
jgi:hypothetical protein